MNTGELQQAIQDAIREERKQTIKSLQKLKISGALGNIEKAGYNRGLGDAQRYLRALNEREGKR